MPARPLFLALVSFAFSLGCVGEPPVPQDGQSAKVTPEPPGANCPTGGVSVQVGTGGPSYVCNGVSSDVANTVTVVAEPAGTNCALGGVRVNSGTNPPLYVCNGATGVAGDGGTSTVVTPEAPGANCASGGVRLQVAGSAPQYVCNGATGAAGASTVVTSEAPGANCASGGVRVQVEGSAPQYVCNGATGAAGDAGASTVVTPEAPGANCANGGLRVQPANGPPSFVCNGGAGRPTLVVMSTEYDGNNCEVGGVRFDTGLDANGNGLLESGEITQTRYVCDGIGLGTGFVATRTPDPATVFNDLERTYRYNNCTNSIWNRQADVIVSGQSCDPATKVGYWAHGPAAAYPTDPNNDLTRPYARLVQIPATDTVVFTVGPTDVSSRGAGDSSAPNIRVGTISRTTGLISNVQTAVFSDGYTGSCRLLSSSRTQLLCFDGATTIRRYRTTAGSATLTAAGSVTLGQQLPNTATCPIMNQWCMGGTFAWDGAFFYFAQFQGGNANRTYLAFTEAGALVGTFTASGTGNINGTYFDWSVGRYSTHDVFGVRSGGLQFGPGSGATHVFSPVSPNHTLY